MKKTFISIIISVITIIMLVFGFQHSVYADEIIPEDIINRFNNKNNSSNNSMSSSNTVTTKTSNNKVLIISVAGGLVLIAVGTSILFFKNKSKEKNRNKQ